MRLNKLIPHFNYLISPHAKKLSILGHFGSKTDCFIKNSLSENKTGKLASRISLSGRISSRGFTKELTKLYDQVFYELFSKSSYLQKLELPKPKLIFKKLKSACASYSPSDNVCKVNLSSLKKKRFMILDNKDGLVSTNGALSLSSRELSKLKKQGKLKDLKIKKLSKDDFKLVFLSSILHELRHCVQMRALLNVKSFDKEIIPDLMGKKLLKKIIPFKRLEIKTVPKWLKNYIKKESPYIFSFNTNKPLKDIIIKNKLQGKKIEFSTKDHFYKGFQETFDPKYLKGDIEYLANTLEIDANAFAANFLLKDRELTKDFDKKLKENLIKFDIYKSSKGYEALEKYGYPPLIAKD